MKEVRGRNAKAKRWKQEKSYRKKMERRGRRKSLEGR